MTWNWGTFWRWFWVWKLFQIRNWFTSGCWLNNYDSDTDAPFWRWFWIRHWLWSGDWSLYWMLTLSLKQTVIQKPDALSGCWFWKEADCDSETETHLSFWVGLDLKQIVIQKLIHLSDADWRSRFNLDTWHTFSEVDSIVTLIVTEIGFTYWWLWVWSRLWFRNWMHLWWILKLKQTVVILETEALSDADFN